MHQLARAVGRGAQRIEFVRLDQLQAGRQRHLDHGGVTAHAERRLDRATERIADGAGEALPAPGKEGVERAVAAVGNRQQHEVGGESGAPQPARDRFSGGARAQTVFKGAHSNDDLHIAILVKSC